MLTNLNQYKGIVAKKILSTEDRASHPQHVHSMHTSSIENTVKMAGEQNIGYILNHILLVLHFRLIFIEM